MALPRLLSEYFAARAQLETLISAKTAGEIAIKNHVATSNRRAANERTPYGAHRSSGERRLPACSIRQLAECMRQRKHWNLRRSVRGKLPRTTGQRPVLPRTHTCTLLRSCRLRLRRRRRFERRYTLRHRQI